MSAKYRIPFNRPSLTGAEFDYMSRALASGHASGDGPYSKACHRFLENVSQARRVLLTTSCTHALEMAALLLGIVPGDEVIVPSFTFVSTVNAFVLRGQGRCSSISGRTPSTSTSGWWPRKSVPGPKPSSRCTMAASPATCRR